MNHPKVGQALVQDVQHYLLTTTVVGHRTRTNVDDTLPVVDEWL